MFNPLHEAERVREGLDAVHGVEDFARHLNLPAKAALAGYGVHEIEKLRARRRCMVILHRIICCVVVLAAIAIVVNAICCKLHINKKEAEEEIDQEKKELIQKLSKIKGKTSH